MLDDCKPSINRVEIAVEYVWDVEGPVDTLLAYFGGTGYASAYGEGSSQRSEAWFVIQNQAGDPVAVLSAPMGSTPSGVPSLPMRIAWRGVFCNTGGVVFSQDHSWQMPALRIGHKGLHVERLDVLAYLFNRTYWPERFQIGTGRTNAQEIASRNAGATQTPSSWTPHPRDHSADLLILMRNRAMIASHGRFLQPDPNAAGLPVMGDLSFGGSALSPPRPRVLLAGWMADGLNVLSYCRGDSVNVRDPLGLYGVEDWWDDTQEGWDILWEEGLSPLLQFGEAVADTWDALSSPGGLLGSMAESLVAQYAVNMEDDFDWAMDWSRRDDDYSRTSSRWVYKALAEGAWSHYNLDYWVGEPSDEQIGPAVASARGRGKNAATGRGRLVPGLSRAVYNKRAVKFDSVHKPEYWKNVAKKGRPSEFAALFDWNEVNLQLMRRGKAPLGKDGHSVHLDHIKPLYQGGTNERANLRPMLFTDHKRRKH